jgi:hypothetical protein
MIRRPQRLHAAAFAAWGVVPTAAAALVLARGPVRAPDLGLAAFALAWWAAAVCLLRDRRGAPAAALGLVAVPWTLALVQTVRRAAFVARTGGLEHPSGRGSPMAFLLGVLFEQLVCFLPLTVVGWLVWRAMRRARPTPA